MFGKGSETTYDNDTNDDVKEQSNPYVHTNIIACDTKTSKNLMQKRL